MLHVIGVGFGRTGTASLKVALEQLGFGPCYHMIELVEHPERVDEWIAAADGRADWDRVFAGYRSTVDWPGAAFWRGLVGAYPEAKVILTVRDPERWYDSASSTIFRRMRPPASPAARLVGRLMLRSNPAMRRLGVIPRRLIWEGVFDGRFDDRAYAIEVFERHTREVRELVPPERLLTYEVSAGWGPLCDFLGVPVPATPFPRLNDAESFRRMQRRRMLEAVSVPLGITVAVLAAGVVGALALRRRRR
jgi:hypothetical protein